MAIESTLTTRIVKEALSRLRESKWESAAVRSVALGLGHKNNTRVSKAFKAAEDIVRQKVSLAVEGAVQAFAQEIDEANQRAMEDVPVQVDEYEGPEQRELREELLQIADDLRADESLPATDKVKLIQALMRAEKMTHTDVHEVTIVDFADAYPKETVAAIEKRLKDYSDLARDTILSGKVDMARLAEIGI